MADGKAISVMIFATEFNKITAYPQHKILSILLTSHLLMSNKILIAFHSIDINVSVYLRSLLSQDLVNGKAIFAKIFSA